MGTTTNTAANTANSLISAAVSGAESAVEALILADAPYMATPGLKQLMDLAISYIGGKFAQVLEETATFAVIDVQVGSEESNISQALQNLISAEKTGNAAQIQSAIKAYAAAQSALVGDDGSAHIS